MRAVLQDAIDLLAAVVILLGAAIVVIRIALRRRYRRERSLRPQAELAVAEYLADPARAPSAGDAGQRAVLLAVALEALGDVRGSERAHLAELIERLGYVAEALSGLSARRRAVRRRSAATLEVVAPASAAPALAAGLADRDAVVRATCARALAGIGGGDAAAAAIAAVMHDDVPLAAGEMAAMVVTLGTSQPSALAPLLGGDAALPVRRVAAEVAGRLRLSEHTALLRACLGDRDEVVAAAAARGLGLIGDSRSAGPLMDLASNDSRVLATRTAALNALGSLGEASAVPLLESQLGAGDWSLAAAAVRALPRLGDPGIAALRRAVASGRPEVSALAEAALEQ